MHNANDVLGTVIKQARLNNQITREQLAEKLDISSRYLTSIENENKKPSYEVLYKLIRELGIPADDIFFPEIHSKNSEPDQLIRLISKCDKRSIRVLFATARELLEQQ